ncbi:targeting protein for Xklp2 isoform X1 [Lates japonicus]|uniref:Targeting protein for Xklp2 isoform X1 n=1 Tax=Lates japonicus TaxID=270547 RepID=A0AAD3M1R7_LATJO|nr:targeting protein for Xklp2 isoform X1 [Lates japonicus]
MLARRSPASLPPLTLHDEFEHELLLQQTPPADRLSQRHVHPAGVCTISTIYFSNSLVSSPPKPRGPSHCNPTARQQPHLSSSPNLKLQYSTVQTTNIRHRLCLHTDHHSQSVPTQADRQQPAGSRANMILPSHQHIYVHDLRPDPPAEKVPQFKAQPLPDFDNVVLPEKKKLEPTKPEPFRLLLDERGAVKSSRWEQMV